MRHALLLCTFLSLGTATATAPAGAQSPAFTLESAAWLAGCWRAEGKEQGSGEHWMQPAGGTMLGASRTVKGGRTVAFEFMQIKSSPAGSLVFVALPSGQRETTFTLAQGQEGLLVFENLQHDFPQQVSYQARPGGGLLARIAGTRAGVQRSMDFPMTRVPCEKL